MLTRTEAIKQFLLKNGQPDLAILYSPAMECQVNVGQDGGDKIKGDFQGRPWHGWTDGIQTWKSYRIPYHANTVPEYEDKSQSFDLSAHVEGIGMTGWDWKSRASKWVAFDFDAITGHKDRHNRKMDDADIEKVIQEASKIPWVTVRRSASGKGLHLYVFLEPVVFTNNHNEHAALARAILGQMSGITGFAFDSKVDICGQNMWVWHRKSKDTNGLTLVKSGTKLDSVPIDWKSHTKVVTGHRRRNIPKALDNSDTLTSFVELAGQVNRIQLDSNHLDLVKYLEQSKTGSWWDSDNHMLITHTWHLKTAHKMFSWKGIYETDSKGTEAPDDVNCFCFPRANGSWVVRRYSMGVAEHRSWTQDSRGYTRCFVNCDPDLSTVAMSHGGQESASGAFVFTEALSAIEAASKLGAVIPALPPSMNNKKATIKPHKDGRILFEIEGDESGAATMPDWLYEKKKWRRLFRVKMTTPAEYDMMSFDNLVRHLTSSKGEDQGWVINQEANLWRDEPLIHIKTALQSMNLKDWEVKNILGSSILKPWKLVNRPFQSEFPGDREWNRDAAQFKFVPSPNIDSLNHPTWNKILKHAGAGLDEAIRDNPWAKVNGIETGADYLRIWCASVFKQPNQPLPYLFFYSKEQDTGKTTFHEALSGLLTKGYVRADTALTDDRGFNGELASAILCVIEEVNLSKAKHALNRIKDWVTAKDISIHPKGGTPCHFPNTTHWIQCANDISYCPTFPGDTRITVIHVPTIDVIEMIPKSQLLPMLEREASDFLASLLAIEIPPPISRLNIPVIATEEKQQIQDSNKNPLEVFVGERCKSAPGYMIPVGEFYEKFSQALEPDELNYWSKSRVSKEFPMEFAKGRNPKDGSANFGNITWIDTTVDKRHRLRIMNRSNLNYLVPADDLAIK